MDKNYYVLIVLLFTLLLSGCNSNSAATNTEVKKENSTGSNTEAGGKKLRLGYINATGSTSEGKPALTGAEGWAVEKGFLQEELKKIGITEIEYYSFPNGPNLNEAMASGDIDLGIFGDTPALLARGAGQKTRLIGLANIYQDIWLVTNKKNGISKLEDLKGKTVAASNGSYMFRFVQGLLKEEGLLDEVKFVSLFPPEALASLERGDIQAYAFPTYMGPKHVKLGFPLVLQASKTTPELTGTSVIVATETYLDENPKFLSSWDALRKKSVVDLKEHSEEYFQFAADVSHQDLDVVRESIPLDNFREESFPDEGIKLLEGTKQFLAEQKLIKNDFDLEDWILRE
ncbi:ABC transporter substrate-binding protein [Neobacillus niacini]|uniref:ABC transporter substrate-binding protein n=1 Tax=Neobacillus niacini TaxID=86668 RepID=UPI003983B967